MATLTLQQVRVEHRQRDRVDRALDSVDLDVGDGELLGVVGASGAGKSTLLRVVAGLEDVAGGRVLIGGVDVTERRAAARDVAMVFQLPHLLPHRSVGRNVAFPLEVRRQTIAEIRTRVSAEARALHIESLLERSPRELSAGEAQLVQIARAMVRVPQVLLLDEPLARLDPALRERMRRELRVLQSGYGVTTLFTTNDPVEAMAMSDRLAVLHAGRLVQLDVPIAVYREPATVEAAVLTGPLELDRVTVGADRQGYWLHGRAGRAERAWRPSLDTYVGREVLVGVRPDDARLFFDPDTGTRLP